MIPIVSFIGWHDSGKTTFVRKVVEHLKQMDLRVAVVKSTQHTGLVIDTPGSDTDLHRKAGADTVILMAPDQMVMFGENPGMKLTDLANRRLHNFDIIIGEGFKHEHHISKIEVTRDPKNPLSKKVGGVIAMVTDTPEGENVFGFDQSQQVAEFIFNRFFGADEPQTEAVLYVDGRKIPMKGFVQSALAGTVHGFVQSLKKTGGMREIELRIRLEPPQE